MRLKFFLYRLGQKRGRMYFDITQYNKFKNVEITDEKQMQIEEALYKWVEQPNSWIVPQFLQEYGLGWSLFQHILAQSPRLTNVFDVIVAKLATKWITFAFDKKELAPHMQKLLMKYLKAYDNHVYFLDIARKKELMKEEFNLSNDYASENYASRELEGIYHSVYSDNINKTGSRKKA